MFNLKPEDKIGKVIKEIQNEENNDKSTKEKINKSQSYRLISTKGMLANFLVLNNWPQHWINKSVSCGLLSSEPIGPNNLR